MQITENWLESIDGSLEISRKQRQSCTRSHQSHHRAVPNRRRRATSGYLSAIRCRWTRTVATSTRWSRALFREATRIWTKVRVTSILCDRISSYDNLLVIRVCRGERTLLKVGSTLRTVGRSEWWMRELASAVSSDSPSSSVCTRSAAVVVRMRAPPAVPAISRTRGSGDPATRSRTIDGTIDESGRLPGATKLFKLNGGHLLRLVGAAKSVISSLNTMPVRLPRTRLPNLYSASEIITITGNYPFTAHKTTCAECFVRYCTYCWLS